MTALRRFVTPVVLLFLVTACMFEPANETELASIATLVEFRGVSITPRATVRIDAAAAPDGPFAQIATATTSDTPLLLGGALLYAFSTTVAVPRTHMGADLRGSRDLRARARRQPDLHHLR